MEEEQSQESVSKEDVVQFSEHCVYIRSLYTLALRIWRDSDEEERAAMETISPSFFDNTCQMLTEYLVIAACRITDRASDKGKENFTVDFFAKYVDAGDDVKKQLSQFSEEMNTVREKITPARHKVCAHADRETIRADKPIGAASWKEWDQFWKALEGFVQLLNVTVIGTPFEIRAAGVMGDAEMLLKALLVFDQSRKPAAK